MHEYSIVTALLELCENHAKSNQAKKVTKVVVALGERSGVEPQLLESAFEVFKLDSVCAESELVIETKPMKFRCHSCGAEFSPKGIDFGSCEVCKAPNPELVGGKEMHLQSLEMEAEDEG